MKRAIALSFLVLANMAILVHVVIPHHHHNNFVICFLTSHCTDDEEASGHPYDCNHHQHNDDGTEECLLLTEMYIKIDNNRSVVDLNFHNDFQYPVLLLLVNPIIKITDLENLPFRQTPYLLSYYTEYIARSTGLRAPPAC